MENSSTLLSVKEFFSNNFLQNKKVVLLTLTGLILIGLGVIYFKKLPNLSSTKVEVLNDTTVSQESSKITVEINGAVENPGVYKLAENSRIEDLLIISGGFSKDADRLWTDKYLNRASKLNDGQKVYIPKAGEQTLGVSAKEGGGDQTISSSFSTKIGGQINVNTASLEELDSLPGIGQVYGQSIIDHRPYSDIEEIVKKGAIKQNVFEKIKKQITVY